MLGLVSGELEEGSGEEAVVFSGGVSIHFHWAHSERWWRWWRPHFGHEQRLTSRVFVRCASEWDGW